jgi:uncharacterized protein YjbJ (UPF0337 family)
MIVTNSFTTKAMHEDKKPLDLAQETAKEIAGKVTDTVSKLFGESTEKLKGINFQEKLAEIKEKGNAFKNAASDLLEKYKK